jgi:hypothetical protein
MGYPSGIYADCTNSKNCTVSFSVGYWSDHIWETLGSISFTKGNVDGGKSMWVAAQKVLDL